jgi:hypothetical protein
LHGEDTHKFGAQKSRDFQGPTPSHLPKKWIYTHQKHYAQGCINHRCIGGFMQRAHEGGFRAHAEGGEGAGA